MTTQDFIFSNKLGHRLSRHLVFWFIWAISYNLFFHFPIHVFKGWNLSSPPTANLQRLGIAAFFLKTLVINSIIAVIVPLAIFTYLFIYWLVPEILAREMNLVTKLLSCLSFGIAVIFTASLFKYAPALYNYLTGLSQKLPAYSSVRKFSFIDQLSTVPLVLGSALTVMYSKRAYLKQIRSEQLARENLNAELQLLKAQIHPHFLFNTINNIYFHTLTLSDQAPLLLKKLSDLMKYFMTECNKSYVPLQKEIQSLTDYLTLEKLRYGNRLELEVSVPENCQGYYIAPLLLIPFIENSFKHGASLTVDSSFVKLNISLTEHQLEFSLSNNVSGASESQIAKGNIGLKNVKKRLELLYPDAYTLQIDRTENEYTVNLRIDLQQHNMPEAKTNTEPWDKYAMA